MNILKNLRKPYLALITGALFLFFSCTQNELLIDENPEDLITSEIEFLHNNATWANIIYLLPKNIPDNILFLEKIFTNNDPLFSNYTKNFVGCLDYLFITNKITTQKYVIDPT